MKKTIKRFKRIVNIFIAAVLFAGMMLVGSMMDVSSADDVVINFNSTGLQDNRAITSHQGITFGSAPVPWNYWSDNEYPGYTGLILIDSASPQTVTITYSNPTYVLKGVKAGGGAFKLRSSGNPEVSVTDTAMVQHLTGWTQPSPSITIETVGGAWNIAWYEFTFSATSATVTSTSTTTVTTIPPTTKPVVIGNGDIYYVKTDGNDSANGKSVANAFKTVQKAADIMVAGDTCYILGGTYRETVIPSSSGAAGNPISFLPYNNEKVTISGADLLENTWSVHSGSIYKTDMGSKTVDQLFVDGYMNIKARWPNAPMTAGKHPDLMSNMNTAQSATEDSITRSTIPNIDWTGGKIWLNPGDKWTGYIRKITASTAGKITYESKDFGWFTDDHGQKYYIGAVAGTDFYLFDKLEAIDTGGEWYCDKTGSNRNLYLQTIAGDSPVNHKIEYRARDITLDLSNSGYINVSGIDFFSGNISLKNSNNCIVSNGSVLYGEYFEVAEGYANPEPSLAISGNNNLLDNMEVAYSAGGGIHVMGIANTVSNCYIHDVDFTGGEYGGITFGVFDFAERWGKKTPRAGPGQHKDLVLYNNEITRTGRSGILAHFEENGMITHNKVYNIGLMTKDLGCIYIDKDSKWATGKTTTLAYNTFHTTTSMGIYFDGGMDYSVHHNVVYGCNWSGFHLNGTYIDYGDDGKACPRNIFFYNNTIDSSVSIGEAGTQHYENVLIQNNIFNGNFANRIAVKPGWITDANNHKRSANGDPKFVNGAGRDYRLAAGSPCIENGVVIAGITDGYTGKAPSQGAFEYYMGAVAVTGINVTSASAQLITLGQTMQMSASITPITATDKTVTWSVEPAEGVASISASGLLTATGEGTVTVKATANDGSGVTGTKTIKVDFQTGVTTTDPTTDTTTSTMTTAPTEKGDINGDGKINAMDLLLMKQHILDVPGKKIEQGTNAFKAADMNEDGKINGMDLLLLKKKILG